MNCSKATEIFLIDISKNQWRPRMVHLYHRCKWLMPCVLHSGWSSPVARNFFRAVDLPRQMLAILQAIWAYFQSRDYWYFPHQIYTLFFGGSILWALTIAHKLNGYPVTPPLEFGVQASPIWVASDGPNAGSKRDMESWWQVRIRCWLLKQKVISSWTTGHKGPCFFVGILMFVTQCCGGVEGLGWGG